MGFLKLEEEDFGITPLSNGKWLCPLINIWGNQDDLKKFIISEDKKDQIVSRQDFVNYFGVSCAVSIGGIFTTKWTVKFAFIVAILTIIILAIIILTHLSIIKIIKSGEEFNTINHGDLHGKE